MSGMVSGWRHSSLFDGSRHIIQISTMEGGSEWLIRPSDFIFQFCSAPTATRSIPRFVSRILLCVAVSRLFQKGGPNNGALWITCLQCPGGGNTQKRCLFRILLESSPCLASTCPWWPTLGSLGGRTLIQSASYQETLQGGDAFRARTQELRQIFARVRRPCLFSMLPP